MGKGDRVIGYLRVSTEEQGASGLGLQAQQDAILAACATRGWTLVRFEEDVLSGGSLSRPGLQRAIWAVEFGEANGIVVAKLDRLSRSLLDFASLLERARTNGWNVVALDLGVDLSTPAGEMLAGVMATVAQWERRVISERTKDALAVAKARGVAVGRPATIEPELAARIRRWHKEDGLSLRAICALLEETGTPTPRGGSVWRPSSIRAVLR